MGLVDIHRAATHASLRPDMVCVQNPKLEQIQFFQFQTHTTLPQQFDKISMHFKTTLILCNHAHMVHYCSRLELFNF
jgi:hypothetical protein